MKLRCDLERKYRFALIAMFGLLLLAGIGRVEASTFKSINISPEGLLRPKPFSKGQVAELSRGKLLVASKNMGDRIFARTVVLITSYGADGAAGVIINRPTDMKLSAAVPDIKGVKDRPDVVYFGGPIDTGRILLLVRTPTKPDDAVLIIENVYASGSVGLFTRLVADDADKGRFRAYAGYAGWAPGQLESELARDGWRVMDATVDVIFSKDPLGVWKDLMR